MHQKWKKNYKAFSHPKGPMQKNQIFQIVYTIIHTSIAKSKTEMHF
jgi:hypothetical protein